MTILSAYDAGSWDQVDVLLLTVQGATYTVEVGSSVPGQGVPFRVLQFDPEPAWPVAPAADLPSPPWEDGSGCTDQPDTPTP
ncbi:hypothetical protein SAMN05660359_04497 [Geodermatophilus obscurus]|uniref:Uncharacterized protein n=1 Tax=Geodermatophilus obscurus TaxID=1861 RepID=A0A1I5IDT9_9ACTN|nr:hypothetical protein [Geodermatophilus obscurus]SFO58231.1 hypothetical protein SAMN05660359_04497 [Geodermatophilus obscurus]